MFWSDDLVEDLSGPQVVNDSKTPSGPVHVGSLRGVLIHDAVHRSALDRGLDSRYRYGFDDYDPLDALPPGREDELREHLGRPLCEVPAPADSPADDYAAHHSGEFARVLAELGVSAELYRTRDLYRGGTLNESIDVILRHAELVADIDRRVSGADRPEGWLPFNPLCERCGRIGTTLATDYDGSTVAYTCASDKVPWATGCGHSGRVSPFDGAGKLSWKLEWVAKWHALGVTVEGAGKDHNAEGGSRDVAVACLAAVFGEEAPLNVPYEFFLVGGAKMSTSGGRGVSAREMADLLPPRVLRFLVLRPEPRTTVDFRPTEARITQIFNDLDRHRERVHAGTATPVEARTWEMSLLDPDEDPVAWAPPFDTVVSIVQLPHLAPARTLAGLKEAPVTDGEREEIARRIRAAGHWLEHYADPDERIELREELPEAAAGLGIDQRGFLRLLRSTLARRRWRPDALQDEIFETARLVPVRQRGAFSALYRAFLDRDSGPKAGNLLAFLARDRVMARLAEIPCGAREFVTGTAVGRAEALERVTDLEEVANLRVWTWEVGADLASVELLAVTDRGRRHGSRIAVDGSSHGEGGGEAAAHAAELMTGLTQELADRLDRPVGIASGEDRSFDPDVAFGTLEV